MALTLYNTASRTRPGIRHELVTHEGRVLSCTCPAWYYHGRCRHAARLADFMAEFRREPDAGQRQPDFHEQGGC